MPYTINFALIPSILYPAFLSRNNNFRAFRIFVVSAYFGREYWVHLNSWKVGGGGGGVVCLYPSGTQAVHGWWPGGFKAGTLWTRFSNAARSYIFQKLICIQLKTLVDMKGRWVLQLKCYKIFNKIYRRANLWTFGNQKTAPHCRVLPHFKQFLYQVKR